MSAAVLHLDLECATSAVDILGRGLWTWIGCRSYLFRAQYDLTPAVRLCMYWSFDDGQRKAACAARCEMANPHRTIPAFACCALKGIISDGDITFKEEPAYNIVTLKQNPSITTTTFWVKRHCTSLSKFDHMHSNCSSRGADIAPLLISKKRLTLTLFCFHHVRRVVANTVDKDDVHASQD